MEDDFYATIKFKSGEEIFALVGYSEEEDRTFLLLESPITIQKVKNRNGGSVYAYKVEPWLKTTKEDMFIMNLDNVMTLSESTDMEMICMHQNFIRDSHEDAQQHTKLNRRMGYVATVNAARAKLEEIYKDSQNNSPNVPPEP